MGFFSKRYHPPGTAPGTLTAEPPASPGPTRIRIVEYDTEHYEEIADADLGQCHRSLAQPAVTWVHVQGTLDPSLHERLGSLFGMHLLALEDILNRGQRPKTESYDDQLFVVCHLPRPGDRGVELTQASFFLGEGFVLSFCEGPADWFEPVLERLRNNTGRIRQRGADYLLYCLLDLAIDQGFPLMQALGERLDQLEEALLATPQQLELARLHVIRRDLLLLRRDLWPLREAVNRLANTNLALIGEDTRLYLRDCHDHVLQIIELVETYRDVTAGMLDVYLSSVSLRLNETMRVLAVIATLFIPPTFVVGLYGMNFDPAAGPLSMPELSWPLGYLGVWCIILAMVAGMLLYFRRKHWF